MDWKRERKISTLPNCEVTAEVALARALEKASAGFIKSVYIGIEWNDGTFVADWSSMRSPDLAAHALVAQHNAFEELKVPT